MSHTVLWFRLFWAKEKQNLRREGDRTNFSDAKWSLTRTWGRQERDLPWKESWVTEKKSGKFVFGCFYQMFLDFSRAVNMRFAGEENIFNFVDLVYQITYLSLSLWTIGFFLKRVAYDFYK